MYRYLYIYTNIYTCIGTEIIFILIWAYVYIVFCMWSAVCICNWLLITWVPAYDHIIDLFHMLIYSVWYWICRNAWNCFVSLRPNVSVAVLNTCVCVCSWLEHPIQIPDPIAAGIWSVASWKITISYADPPVELNSPFRISVEEKLWHLVLVVPSNWFPHMRETTLKAAQMKFLRHLLGITKLDKEKTNILGKKKQEQRI